jgi:hypothetical protein
MAIPLQDNFDAGGTATIVNLPTPVNNGDAASKSYVDTVAGGVLYKSYLEDEVIRTTTSTTPAAITTLNFAGLTIGKRYYVTGSVEMTNSNNTRVTFCSVHLGVAGTQIMQSKMRPLFDTNNTYAVQGYVYSFIATATSQVFQLRGWVEANTGSFRRFRIILQE